MEHEEEERASNGVVVLSTTVNGKGEMELPQLQDDPWLGWYDIDVYGEESKSVGNGIQSSSVGNFDQQKDTEEEGEGMDMVPHFSNNIEDKVVGMEGGDGSTYCSHTNPLPVFDCTTVFTTTLVFPTEKELKEWVSSKGRENGFVIVVKGSEKMTNRRRPRIRFSCERSGRYRPYLNKAKKVKEGEQNEGDGGSLNIKKPIPRVTSSKKCNCPFEISCVKGLEGWSIVVVNGMHNHPPAEHLEGHPYPGRLSTEEAEMVVEISASSRSTPKQILSMLKSKGISNVSTIKSVYNARYKHRLQERAGRTQMQFLFSKLQDNEYMFFHRKDDQECVTSLFWSHPTSVDLLHVFPRLLLMDCTYKTNRYKFPLFQIVGVTSTDKTFLAGQAFIDSEKEEKYVWVLENLKRIMVPDELPHVIVTDRDLALMNAIEKVFPTATHLLCRWHIEKNVVANCKKHFDDKAWPLFMHAWTSLIFSSDVPTYNYLLAAMKRDFEFLYPKAIEYIEERWLVPYKDRFVSAWTNNVMHFGNQTSNRAEQEHSRLKGHMNNGQADFESIWARIHDSIKLQIVEIKSSFEKSLIAIQHHFQIPLFDNMRGSVSQTAMALMMPEIKRVDEIGNKGNGDCACHIRRTHGLPCAHLIAPFKHDNLPIPTELIDEHWKKLGFEKPKDDQSVLSLMRADFDLFMAKVKDFNQQTLEYWRMHLRGVYFPSTSSLKEPKRKAVTRGRKKGSVNKSMRRDPSFFEHVEMSMKTPKVKEKTVKKANVKVCAPKSKTGTPSCGTDSNVNGDVKKNRTPSTGSKTPLKKAKIVRKLFMGMGPYADQFPIPIRQFIHCTDVVRDGNCGFRVVSLHWNGSEHDWSGCRQEMLKEVANNYDLYENVTGVKGGAHELCKQLAWDNHHSEAPRDKWMTFPIAGHVIATTFKSVLVFLSLRQCLTFLPLRSALPSPEYTGVMAIGLVNDNHFVKVDLKRNSPLPPIAANWYKYRQDVAKEWDAPFLDRIGNFNALIGNSVATRELFNLNAE